MTLEKKVEELTIEVAMMKATIAELKQAAPTSRAKPKLRIKPDWEPNLKTIEWSQAYGDQAWIDEELEKFRDYFISTGTVRSDWNASFKNWIRKAKDFAKTDKGQSVAARRSGSRTTQVNATNRERADRAIDKLLEVRRRAVALSANTYSSKLLS